MKIEELKKKVKEFDKKAGFDKTEFSKLVKMIEKEVKILETNSRKRSVVNHKLTDILILLMQIAHRYDTNFDKEISKWFKKSKKYI